MGLLFGLLAEALVRGFTYRGLGDTKTAQSFKIPVLAWMSASADLYHWSLNSSCVLLTLYMPYHLSKEPEPGEGLQTPGQEAQEGVVRASGENLKTRPILSLYKWLSRGLILRVAFKK